MVTGGGGTEPSDKAGARARHVPIHLEVAGDGLSWASAWATTDRDDGFRERSSEIGWVWIGSFDVFEQLHLQLLHRPDLDVALLAHGHARHELALERAELGWSEWS